MSADVLHMLLSATLASSVSIALVLLLRKPIRARLSAGAAYALWAMVPLSAAAPLMPAPIVSMSLQNIPSLQSPLASAVPQTQTSMLTAFDISPWLVCLWIAGSVFALALLIGQQRRFVRGLGRLSVLSTHIVRAESKAGCPALVGAWRPQVVLPADFEQRYSATERVLILAHERHHRACGDAQINWLAAMLRCVFWLNPLVHFAASRFRFDQELACDAVVMSHFPESRRSYADAMLKTQLADFGLPVGCHWQSSHPLKERIAMLKNPLPGRMRTTLGAVIATVLIVIGSYGAWAVQPAETAKDASSKRLSETDNTRISYRKLRPPVYPEQAQDSGVEGILYVRVQVDNEGKVTNAAIEYADPPAVNALAATTLEVVKAWSFNPAKANGKAIPGTALVPIRYDLGGQVIFASPSIAGRCIGSDYRFRKIRKNYQGTNRSGRRRAFPCSVVLERM